MSNQKSDADAKVLERMRQRDRATFAAIASLKEPYVLGPDSTVQNGVPRGTVTKYHWKSTHIYPGMERDYWIYVPQQYDGSRPVCLMVFQDGEWYIRPDVNIPVAFDNLIHQGQMPITIGVFVNPGVNESVNPGEEGHDNRSLEYDTLDDTYVRFLLEELLPEVEQHYKIVDDPEGRAICGISSGGICAFTAAWERPDAFRKVVSHCGSFANIRGGHNYPSLVRRSEARPIRVFLQSGSKDLDVVWGNWAIANQDMAAAFAYREYDYQFVFGEGGHTLKHGAAIFPDTMRWLWRDYPKDG